MRNAKKSVNCLEKTFFSSIYLFFPFERFYVAGAETPVHGAETTVHGAAT